MKALSLAFHFAAPRAPEVKLTGEAPSIEGGGVFTGYASLFGVPDLGRDVVAPGAFRDSLARRGAAGIRMLWQHDPAEPVGRWLSLVEDRRGLRVRGQLNLQVRRARELAAMLRDGSVDGLSIGFRTEKARPERGGRRLEKIDLWEISLVTFPMMPGARIDPSGLPARQGAKSRAEARVVAAIRRAARRFQPQPA